MAAARSRIRRRGLGSIDNRCEEASSPDAMPDATAEEASSPDAVPDAAAGDAHD